MEQIRDAAIAAGVVSPAEVDTIVAEFEAFGPDPETLMSIARSFQVWGRRAVPARGIGFSLPNAGG